MLRTGVRIGEALAFRWADIDLGSAIATGTVTGTVVRVPGEGLTIQDHPKTASGRRRLMLPRFIVSMLMRRQLDVVEPNAWDLVFPSSTGTLPEPQNVHRQWRAARGRAGMDWITPDVFRKSVATVIGLGDVRAAAGQLDHSGTAVTERHYLAKTHQGPDARALLEVFGRPADGQDELGTARSKTLGRDHSTLGYRSVPRPFSQVRGCVISAPGGIRTPNLLIRSQMLYPLSYRRLCSCVQRYCQLFFRYCQPATPGRTASAEAEGFEPSVQLPAQHISSVSHSAALARFPGPPQGGHRVRTLPGGSTALQNSGAHGAMTCANRSHAGGIRTGRCPSSAPSGRVSSP